MQRIHIVGCGPRSGTTLIFEAMTACFEIDLYGTHEESIYRWPPRFGNIFLSKSPSDILVVEPVLRIMPNLHVIYMVRDPRDMVVSRHGSAPDRYWSSLKYWKAYTPYGQKLQAHPRFITIRYEDLVAQPDQIQSDLMKRMPFLVKRAAFSRYHEISRPSDAALRALGPVRPISSSSIGSWRKHKPRIAGQLEKHGAITEDLIAYGYEQDAGWEQELSGVQPDLRDSQKQEFFSKQELRKRMRGKNVMALLVPLIHYRPVLSILNSLVRGRSKLRAMKVFIKRVIE